MIKVPIMLEQLKQVDFVYKAIIESMEQALYRLVVHIGDQAYYVKETPKKSLTRRSLVAMQALLLDIPIREMYLQHQSPYDEMIGQEVNNEGNTLLVPIGSYFETNDPIIH